MRSGFLFVSKLCPTLRQKMAPVMRAIKPGSGRVAGVVPHGMMFRGAARVAILRHLIEEILLACVIDLPAVRAEMRGHLKTRPRAEIAHEHPKSVF